LGQDYRGHSEGILPYVSAYRALPR
jgi:hypothetical protein